MLLSVEKYIGHGKTSTWYINPAHIISISPGHNNHTVQILTTDEKIVEVAGETADIVLAFNKATGKPAAPAAVLSARG
jgi:hypothetical protein